MGAFLRRWAPALLMIAAIFLFSSIPSKEMPHLGSYDFLAKKGAHALGYGLLAAALWHGFNWNRKLWWMALTLAVAYAISDEFHQRFVPGRHAMPADVAIDSLGATISLLVCAFVRRRRGYEERTGAGR